MQVLNFAKLDDSNLAQIQGYDDLYSPLLAKMLAVRGLYSREQIHKFLYPNLEEDWLNPYDILGMDKLVDEVELALRNNKRILIYGDYDVDGITATAVMIRGLKEINKHANSSSTFEYFLPNRFDEGYGFTDAAVDRILNFEELPELIISVDCGVTAAPEIQKLIDHGINVVVTDHHEKSNNYPDFIPLIDPKAEDKDNPSSILSGVGVALKLITVLGARFGMPHMWQDFADLAMLGTLADIMHLKDENRAIVYEGLNILNTNPRPCLKALIDVAGKSKQMFSSTDVSYIITPRLNSAGRMNKPEIALELLLCDNYTQAYNLALAIENLNNQRREITTQMLEQADYRAKIILENSPNTRSLVLYGDNWHPGVLGIVAAKICEAYNVVCFVFNVVNGEASGSGRGIGSVDLHQACVESFSKYIKFGGHKTACGATIKADDIVEFSESLENYMQSLDEANFESTIDIDFEVKLHELNVKNVDDLSILEPYGACNECPVLFVRNVFIKKARAVGLNFNHLSCNITDGVYGAQAIMFNVKDIENYLKIDSSVCAVFTPKIETYQGVKNVKLYLQNLTPSQEIFGNGSVDCDSNNYLESLFDSYQVVQNNSGKRLGDFIQHTVNLHNIEICENSNDSNKPVDDEDVLNNSIDLKNSQTLLQDVVHAMIGKDGQLHDSQKDCLKVLEDGQSALAVLPTGRGKSLIFQVFASILALKDKKMSLFVYPLRALISDQAFHLQNSLSQFGLKICVLNGETPNDERLEIYKKMKENKLDIVLTTPEFLAIHCGKISESAKVGFVVVDECHHLGEVRIGQRTAYGHMPKILDMLGNPQVLALSATVSDQIATEIATYLPIKKLVTDNYERENLFIDDRRNIKCRDDYLTSLVASGQKTVVYVNSRQQTVDLARMLKSRATHIAMQIGFYNAGMTKSDRKKIEQMFRENKLSVLVATSAFGEGVNIPDIRHVCLYHLPFSETEFNQMAGRCGRDNNPAIVHLLYNRADASINTQILEMSNPTREVLGKIYVWIKTSCLNNNGEFEITNEDLQKMYDSGFSPAAPATILCAFDIFSELDLIKHKTVIKDGKNYSKIVIVDVSGKVNLEDSSRFCEGQNEISSFNTYRNTAMRSSVEQLTELLRHPILPCEDFLTKVL